MPDLEEPALTGPRQDGDAPAPSGGQQVVAPTGRARTVVLVAALVGLFAVGFSITVLAVSVATIAADLDAPVSLMVWVVTGPIFAYAVFGPSAGKLADMLGPRRVWIASMTGVAFCAVLSAAAPSGGLLVASRVLGAAVGAAAGPSSVSMINRMYDRHERARALGWWSMVAAGGPVVGVIVGGPVVEAVSWRWIFVAQVPLTLGAVALGWRVLPNFVGRRDVRFDVPGTVLLAFGSVALLVALNRGPAVGWTHPVVLSGFVACPALLAAFVAVERRSPSPLLPLRYVKERNVSAAVTNQFFLNFAYMGAFTLTPLMLAGVLGWGETKIGLLSIARPLTFAVAGPVAGALAVRVGERTNALVGGAAIAASMVGLSTTGPESREVVIAVSLAFSGLGMGAAAPAMAAALANSVDEHDLGVAAAFQQMCAQIGVVVGTQIMLSVQQALAPEQASNGDGDALDPAALPVGVLDDLVASYRSAYLVGAAAALLGVVAALAVRRSDRRLTRGDLLVEEFEILDGGSNPVVPGP